MTLKVGINGFGRIGRLVFRAAMLDKDIEFVGINDLVPAENLAYLLKYDSTHGRAGADVSATDDALVVNGKKIPCCSVKNPAELPWAKLGINMSSSRLACSRPLKDPRSIWQPVPSVWSSALPPKTRASQPL